MRSLLQAPAGSNDRSWRNVCTVVEKEVCHPFPIPAGCLLTSSGIRPIWVTLAAVPLRSVDQDISLTRSMHVQRARNGRGSQGEHIHFFLNFLKCSLCTTPKRFSSSIMTIQVLIRHPPDQAVSSIHDFHFPVASLRLALFTACETANDFNGQGMAHLRGGFNRAVAQNSRWDELAVCFPSLHFKWPPAVPLGFSVTTSPHCKRPWAGVHILLVRGWRVSDRPFNKRKPVSVPAAGVSG